MYTLMQALLAQGEKGGGGSIWQLLIPLALMLGIVYFLMIKPQKREKEKKAQMINKLKKGDEIYTVGGICGTIFAVKQKSVILEIGDKNKMEILLNAIAGIRGDDDDKSADNKEDKDKKQA